MLHMQQRVQGQESLRIHEKCFTFLRNGFTPATETELFEIRDYWMQKNPELFENCVYKGLLFENCDS